MRQKAKGKGQKAEGKRQRAMGKGQKAEGKRQTVEGRGQNIDSPLIKPVPTHREGDKGGCPPQVSKEIKELRYHTHPLILSILRKPDQSEKRIYRSLIVCTIFVLGLLTSPVQAQSEETLYNTSAPEIHALLDGSSPGEEDPQVQSSKLQPDTPQNFYGKPSGGNYTQLEEYIRIAIEQNPELQSLRAGVDADRERIREAGVLMDPEISIAYDFNPMMSDSYLGRFSISAMQMFPWFGTLEARRDLSRSAANVSRAQISSRQLEILRDLQITWLDIAEIREQIQITEQTLELVRDLEKLVEARYETGRAGLADILRIQMEEQRLLNRITDLNDRIHPLSARFNELLNRDINTEVKTADELHHAELAMSDEETRERIRRLNPVFDMIEAERSAAENEYRLAELDGRPGFGIGVEVMGRDFGPMSMLPDAKESIVGMATIRVPLFRSRYHSQKQQANHRIRSLDLREHQTENRLMAELEEYLEEIRRSERKSILLTDELVPRAQQALAILSEEYSVGNARFDELLQIQRELLDLEFERIEAITNQNRAIANIQSLMGVNND